MAAPESGDAGVTARRDAARPRLAKGVRMRFDAARGRYVLLSPEAILILNPTGTEIVKLCDGQRTIAEIRSELRDRYGEIAADEARDFLDDLIARRGIEVNDD
ncbi:pyrroloquinoline quinone biosynthesis peptide chaperone PqqD [Nocardiopsis salina]|uniref:pyrroloquinoline quinone biosynthesis peptide chaperone PqqD n=1 Tax=Nocardiopsis salina TaxID=245836 RepID=UPI0003457503|nr:pyrroloquinoline quinone biosynthesis peptide chaperone PqqD [Nocardiopsis salina]